jgi:hypothetical protein
MPLPTLQSIPRYQVQDPTGSIRPSRWLRVLLTAATLLLYPALAAQGPQPLIMEPVQPSRDSTELPMAFYVSMGVRRGDNALLQRLDDSLERHHAAISAILADYHVSTLPDAFAPP